MIMVSLLESHKHGIALMRFMLNTGLYAHSWFCWEFQASVLILFS